MKHETRLSIIHYFTIDIKIGHLDNPKKKTVRTTSASRSPCGVGAATARPGCRCEVSKWGPRGRSPAPPRVAEPPPARRVCDESVCLGFSVCLVRLWFSNFFVLNGLLLNGSFACRIQYANIGE